MGEPTTVLEAVRGRRFWLSSWPWRSLLYLLTSLPVAAVVATLLVVASVAVPLMPIPTVERLRLRLVDNRPIDAGRRANGLGRYAEAATWREFGYTCLLATFVPVTAGGLLALSLLAAALVFMPMVVTDGPVTVVFTTVSTPGQAWLCAALGLIGLVALTYLAAVVSGMHGLLARALLSGDKVRAELVEVSASRARLVDAFEAERRRIERDLHDGAQQRLVSLTLQLGLARLDLPDNKAVATAHEQAKELMAELREFIRDIHPQVLTDHGLPDALEDLADRMPLPVSVRAELSQRLPAPVESAAYFVVSEALTNVVKHSAAATAEVTALLSTDLLVVEIADDGHGGADPAGGTGLTGLADRVAVGGGRMLLSSPVGGPTRLRVELPCRSE